MATEWVCPTCRAHQHTEETDEAPVCRRKVEKHRRPGFSTGRTAYSERPMLPADDPRLQHRL